MGDRAALRLPERLTQLLLPTTGCRVDVSAENVSAVTGGNDSSSWSNAVQEC